MKTTILFTLIISAGLLQASTNQIGRFQFISLPYQYPGTKSLQMHKYKIYKFDTATGRTWTLDTSTLQGATLTGWSPISDHFVSDYTKFKIHNLKDEKPLR